MSLLSARLSATLDVHLVKDAALDPQELILFNHPTSTGHIAIVGGSGYFRLRAPEGAAAKTKYISSTNKIEATAVSDGSFNITVVDLCLTPVVQPQAIIRVANMASVELTLSELVEEGSSVEASLILLDATGLPVPIHPSLMQHTVTAQDDVVSVVFDRMASDGSAVYSVTGLRVGDTSLRGMVATTDTRKTRLFSSGQPLQVYPPLRLQPASITLVVGAVYQVS